MTEDYVAALKTRMLNAGIFRRALFRGRRKGQSLPWERVTVRPVHIRGGRHLQFSYFDGRRDITKNYTGAEAEARLDELLALPFKSITVQTAVETLRLQFSRKGRPILHRDRPPPNAAAPPDLSHDRRKSLPLPPDRPDPFLQTIGIMTAEGKIRAAMRDKFWQINRFLQVMEEGGALEQLTASPLRVVDCGCGNAYLTFAAYHYLTHLRGRKVQMVGIDVRDDLLQRRAEQARQLGWEGLTFEATRIIDYQPPAPPDVVLALHACDTATDEALAQAIRWESRRIFAAPCCHHHLQTRLPALKDASPAMRPLLRHGILRERLGDILTDSFRALLLRLMGYRTDVVEFIATEHTPRNLMIRAVQTARPAGPQFLAEYEALKAAWGVTPYLETLLQTLNLNPLHPEP
ncbi:MAG: SAM-dependent methyltransferase [Caldilineae bacterium]|nr:MAG: SAM-dependent methyltransferase [Caldilineae bacterium]